MSNIAKTTTATPAKLESVVIEGDLAQLSPQERLTYYRNVCESVGLNPLTKPFQYLRLSGKLVLYCSKDATDQLRKLHGVSIRIVARERVEDCWIVTAEATDSTGRTDASIGAVGIAGLKGDALANALMKAETKAKRRVTLSISGLGMLDETEIETIPAAVRVDDETGEIEPNLEPELAELKAACRNAARQKGLTADQFTAVIKSVCPSGKINECTAAELKQLNTLLLEGAQK